MTNNLTMRWIPVADATGRTHMEAVWITLERSSDRGAARGVARRLTGRDRDARRPDPRQTREDPADAGGVLRHVPSLTRSREWKRTTVRYGWLKTEPPSGPATHSPGGASMTAGADIFDAPDHPPRRHRGDYTLDAAHSRLGFVARHAMVTKVRGEFAEFSGTAHIDTVDPSRSSVSRDHRRRVGHHRQQGPRRPPGLAGLLRRRDLPEPHASSRPRSRATATTGRSPAT